MSDHRADDPPPLPLFRGDVPRTSEGRGSAPRTNYVFREYDSATTLGESRYGPTGRESVAWEDDDQRIVRVSEH
jgi:hypothetical protein